MLGTSESFPLANARGESGVTVMGGNAGGWLRRRAVAPLLTLRILSSG